MSSVMNIIKNLPESNENDNEENLLNDINYIRKSSSLVTDSLQKGSDVVHMPNGDILITEVKTITYTYKWNKSRKKFERATSNNRTRKRRANQNNPS